MSVFSSYQGEDLLTLLSDSMRSVKSFDPLPLRPDQEEGRDFLASRKKAILADLTGAGKTAQVLSAIAKIGAKRTLYVTGSGIPSEQIVEDGEKFTPHFRIQVVKGPKSLRKVYYIGDSDVLVLGYETFRNDVTILQTLPFDLFVLDDASKAKNPDSALSKACNAFARNVEYGWALTASPVETSLMDIWAVYHAINFYPLGSKSHFSSRYCIWGEGGGRRWKKIQIIGYKRLDEIVTLLKPHYLRREGAETPDLHVVDYPVDLYKEQHVLYQAAKSGVFGTTLYDMFTRALMYCDSTIYATASSPKSSKIDLILQFLKAYSGKVVIYSMWHLSLTHLKIALETNSIRYVEISGKIPKYLRRENQKSFRDDPDVRVMLITKAGEYSINLQSAQIMICMNRHANPQKMRQVYGRIKRTGSAFSDVYVLNLFVKGSVEERIIALLRSRADLSDRVLGDTAIERLTPMQMVNLLVERDDIVEIETTADSDPLQAFLSSLNS
jgi:SNF2 family DNA or RNA helicase